MKEQIQQLLSEGFTKKQISEKLHLGYSTVRKYSVGLKTTLKNKTTFVCKVCSKERPTSYRYKMKNLTCKDCFNKQCSINQKETKRKAVEYLGGECRICGYNKYLGSLSFHHTNPLIKDPRWSKSWSFERLKSELDKCVLLCHNCHNEEHENIRNGKATIFVPVG